MKIYKSEKLNAIIQSWSDNLEEDASDCLRDLASTSYANGENALDFFEEIVEMIEIAIKYNRKIYCLNLKRNTEVFYFVVDSEEELADKIDNI